jgi:hypothetical protein
MPNSFTAFLASRFHSTGSTQPLLQVRRKVNVTPADSHASRIASLNISILLVSGKHNIFSSFGIFQHLPLKLVTTRLWSQGLSRHSCASIASSPSSSATGSDCRPTTPVHDQYPFILKES